MAAVQVLLSSNLHNVDKDVDPSNNHFLYLRERRQFSGNVTKVEAILVGEEERFVRASIFVSGTATLADAVFHVHVEPLLAATVTVVHSFIL
jgi:hypothetical protein